MASPFFDGLMRWPVPEHGILSPLFFHDLSAISLVFNASSAAVRPLLPDRRLKPVELLPGRCLVMIGALQYRDSELGPYNEIVVAFPVAQGDAPLPALDAAWRGLGRTVSAYIWQMPVSTEVAWRVGCGVAGFPKFVADIRFGIEGGQAHAALLHEGRLALELHCDGGDAAGDRTLKLRSFTVKNGVTLQSLMLVHQLRFRDHLQRSAARLELGHGPLADALRGLDLGERPLASQCCSRAEAMLFHPRNLRDD